MLNIFFKKGKPFFKVNKENTNDIEKKYIKKFIKKTKGLEMEILPFLFTFAEYESNNDSYYVYSEREVHHLLDDVIGEYKNFKKIRKG